MIFDPLRQGSRGRGGGGMPGFGPHGPYPPGYVYTNTPMMKFELTLLFYAVTLQEHDMIL